MPVAWDTTLVSRLRPASEELTSFLRLLETEDSPLIPAPTLAEVVFGLTRRAPSRSTGGNSVLWLWRLLRRPDVRVIPFYTQAAFVSGRVRARDPFPPTRRGSDRRSKSERRVSWVNDIAIAATAWTVGVPVATENVSDFEHISALLTELHPRAIQLEVRPSPL